MPKREIAYYLALRELLDLTEERTSDFDDLQYQCVQAKKRQRSNTGKKYFYWS